MDDAIVDLVGSLRRYAAVLVGSGVRGDYYVAACLEALVADVRQPMEAPELRVAAFQALNRIMSSVAPVRESLASDASPDDPVIADVMAVPWRQRQAFLLLTLVALSADEAARTLETTAADVHNRYHQATRCIARHMAERRDSGASVIEGPWLRRRLAVLETPA